MWKQPGEGKWLTEGHRARQRQGEGGPRASLPPLRPDFLEVTQRDRQHRKEVGKGSPARWIPGHRLVSSKPPATLAMRLGLGPVTLQPVLPEATAADPFLRGQLPWPPQGLQGLSAAQSHGASLPPGQGVTSTDLANGRACVGQRFVGVITASDFTAGPWPALSLSSAGCECPG